MIKEHEHSFQPIEPPVLLTSDEIASLNLPLQDTRMSWEALYACECGAQVITWIRDESTTNYEPLIDAWRMGDGDKYDNTILRIAGKNGFSLHENGLIISAR